MTVYVDAPVWGFGRMVMCHMVADTHDELLAMADRIGVQRRWIQKQGTPYEHFDICKSKRRLAVEAGAREVSWSEMSRVWEAKHTRPAPTSESLVQ